MTAPGKLKVDTASGRVTGPANLAYNNPWPCVNGKTGSGAMMGVVMHTMVGDLPGTVSWFNNPKAQASAHFGIAQDGAIHQFGPIGKGWIAWAQAAGNAGWYSIEHADGGKPANPLTAAQITASAQILECLSAFAGFPLEISNSTSVKGYGWHGMGGAAWGGHLNCPGDVRKAQRAQVIALAASIRQGTQPEHAGHGPYRHVTDGKTALAGIIKARNTTAAHLFQVSAGAYTAADEAAVADKVLPAGFPYYTTNP